MADKVDVEFQKARNKTRKLVGKEIELEGQRYLIKSVGIVCPLDTKPGHKYIDFTLEVCELWGNSNG